MPVEAPPSPPGRAASADELGTSSTAPEEPSFRRVRRAQWGRRVLLAILVGILVAGLIGLLGIRTRTAEANANGYDLQVHYASIARPGVEVPFDIRVQRDGGFPNGVTLAVPSSYLSTLDAQSPQPEPKSTTSDGDLVLLQLDTPPGDTFGVAWEAQIDPTAKMGRKEARVTVIGDDGAPAASVSIRTWVLP